MRPLRPIALCALLAAVATALLAAPVAQAEDTFRFESNTGMKFLGANMDSLEGECWFDPSGNLIWEKAAEDGTIHAVDDIFEGCNAGWGANMTYYVNGKGVGAFVFHAFDPVVGSSSVGCEAAGYGWERGNYLIPIEPYMSSEADGDTCTVEWLPGVRGPFGAGASRAAAAWHSRMVDSLAPVAGGAARVAVQVFGRGRRSVLDEVILRTRSGRPIGSATGTSEVGKRAHAIPVPLAPFARRRLAQKHELVVRAVLRHADGTPGTGDETRQLVLRAASQ